MPNFYGFYFGKRTHAITKSKSLLTCFVCIVARWIRRCPKQPHLCPKVPKTGRARELKGVNKSVRFLEVDRFTERRGGEWVDNTDRRFEMYLLVVPKPPTEDYQGRQTTDNSFHQQQANIKQKGRITQEVSESMRWATDSLSVCLICMVWRTRARQTIFLSWIELLEEKKFVIPSYARNGADRSTQGCGR